MQVVGLYDKFLKSLGINDICDYIWYVWLSKSCWTEYIGTGSQKIINTM